MPRPVTVLVKGRYGGPFNNGSSQVVPVDRLMSPFSLSVGVNLEGSVVYQVEHTYDDVYHPKFDPNEANWYRAAGTGIGRSSRPAFGGYSTSPSGVRLRIIAGNGLAKMTVVQSGITPTERNKKPPGFVAPKGVVDVVSADEPSTWQRLKSWFDKGI
jgi:hypothetical protein